MKKRVIIIGLDGASPEIFFDRWKDEFPNIQKIIKNGAHGILKSVIPTSTGPAWTSFATGCSPDKHKVFNFVYPYKSLSCIRPTNSNKIKCKTFYEELEEKGKKCILINLPNSYPPKTKNITITSLLTSSEDFIFPKTLKSEIPALSKYRIAPNDSLLAKGKLLQYIEDVQELEKVRFECAKKLFDKEWEVFFILFSGTDWIQHQAYNKMIKYDKDEPINKRILAFYKELDSYIGWFLDNKEEDDTLFIMSDHGFDTYTGYFYINSIFEKAGFLTYRKTKSDIKTTKLKEERIKKAKVKLNVGWLIKIIRKNRFIYNLSRGIYNLIKKKVSIEIGVNLSVDPKKTKVAALRGTEDAIYINKEGVFDDPSIKKQEYKKFRNFIIDLLKKLKSPTGEKVFTKVLATETKNIENEALPDILLECNKYYMSPGISPEVFEKGIINKHSSRGIIACLGPSINKNVKIRNGRILDIAPSIFHILGQEFSDDIDGKIIKEVIK